MPADPPDSARLLVVRPDAGTLEHRTFRDFPELLRSGDVLVINTTRVVRARLRGTREPGGGAAEILLLRPSGGMRFDAGARRWRALVKPGRRLPIGARVRFGDDGYARIAAVAPDGSREVEFDLTIGFDALLERYGELPLPPYVGTGSPERAARYQTIFAREPGSVAAPTASLHFTPAVLDAIVARGVTIVPLVLDIGLGTFKPIESERIDEHPMHAERYEIPATTAATIEMARLHGRRVVVAGTTALRALESAAGENGRIAAGEGETSLYVTPGYEFRVADALLTNFHLPGSSLLVLVSAFGGYETLAAAYAAAIAARYRFYSFGDAMFIANKE